jgi:hypothetical protein
VRRPWAAVVLAMLALGALGCVGELDPAWLITKPRILGVRNTVAGTERASPLPGERVELELIVVEPSTPDPLVSWTLAACIAEVTTNGSGFCAGMPFAFDIQTNLGGGPPHLTVDVPADAPMGSSLLVVGAVCVNADLVVDLGSMDARCTGAGAGEPMLVTYRLPIGTENFNPVMADDGIALAGMPWPETPSIAGCADLPQARIGDEVRVISVSLRGATREPLLDGGNETLVLSHFTTARELERQYSVLEGDQDTTTPMMIEWTPEEDADRPVPAEGAVVRFWFVLRDGRGGLDSATRALCLMP